MKILTLINQSPNLPNSLPNLKKKKKNVMIIVAQVYIDS